MKSIRRLVFINIAVLLILLVLINFLSHAILFMMKGGISRSELPNYVSNRELARIHFAEFNRSLKTQYDAFVGWSRRPFQGKTITIDSHGDRLHTTIVHDESQTQSVYFFGGSTIWGTGAWDNDTIPALFSSISGMPSYNKGETGYTSRQSLAKFINLLAQGEQIDVAIFYDGVNDSSTHCRTELNVNEHSRTQSIRKRLKRSKKEFVLKYVDYIFLQNTRKLAAEISHKLFGTQTKERRGYVCDKSKDRAQKVTKTLVNNWEIAHDIAQARGIKFFAILQPVAFIGKPKLDHLKLSKTFGLQYKTVYPLLKKVIRERGHNWILDYTDRFSRDEYIYVDWAHVSKNGNKIIANRIYTDIMDKI